MNRNFWSNYVIKDFFHKQKKTKSFIILTILCLMVVFMFSFKSTIDTYFKNVLYNSTDFRSILVQPKEYETEEDFIIRLKNIEHVSDVVTDNELYNSLITDITGAPKSFQLYGSSKTTRPELIRGKDIVNDNEIICPEKFYPDTDITNNKNISSKDFIDMKDYLNKELDFGYYIYNSLGEVKETKSIKMKIVGIYKNTPYQADESVCYSTYNINKKINEEATKLIMDSSVSCPIIVVDKNKNIDLVTEKLDEMNYGYTQVISIDYSFVNIITILMYVVLIIASIFIITIVISIINKEYEISIKKNSILKSIGYKNRDIIKINIIQNNLLCLIETIIFVSILIIGYIVYNVVVYYRPFIFSNIPITINITSIIISIIILFISFNIGSIVYYNKLKNINIVEGVKEL